MVSRGFEKYFINKFPNKKFSFISNGIDQVFLESKFNNTFNKRRKLIYAGNIGYGQGLEKIIPKLSQKISKNWDILIIGDGNSKKSLLVELEKISAKNVFIEKPIEQSELINYYNQADVLFLHLNDFNAFEKVLPSKIFEYGATEKPILAGVSGYAKKFIDSEIINCATFNPCDSVQAFNALSSLKLEIVDRSIFKNKFDRDKLSIKIAQEILNLL